MLRERVTTPPDDGGVWTAKKVAAVMDGEIGLASVAPQRGREALRAIGRTIRRPRPRPGRPACAGSQPRGAGGIQIKLAEIVAEKAARHPGAVIETSATDEHRIGRRPANRRVWAARGQRPVAPCHHRFEWLCVTTFVSPATGESFWYLSSGVDKNLCAETLARVAREAGTGRARIIVRVLDGAGWHTAHGLVVPKGIRRVSLPPYTPELQPAETLWVHVDEPIANRHLDTLAQRDPTVAAQRVALHADRDRVKGQSGFHRWPNRIEPN
jgi:hypothetical protein